MIDDSSNRRPSESRQPGLIIPQAAMPVRLQAQLQIAHQPESSSTTTLDIVEYLRHWWWKCLPLGVTLSIVAGSVVWFVFSPIYEASAWLEIKEQPVYVAFEPRATGGSTFFFQTQLQTIQSPVVLSQVSTQPEIASLPQAQKYPSILDWLQRNLKVTYRGQSELCEVSFRSEQPDVAARVANAVTDAYLALTRDQSGQQTEQIIELLNEEKRRRGADLEQLQERVRVLTKKNEGHDRTVGFGKREIVVAQNPLADLETRRTAAEVERSVLEAKVTAYRQALATQKSAAIPDGELRKAMDSQPEVIAVKQQIVTLKMRLSEYRQRTARGDDGPGVRNLVKSIADAEATLEKTMADLRPNLVEQMRLAVEDQGSKVLADLQANLDSQSQLERLWEQRIEERRRNLDKVGDQSLELEFARADLDRSEEVFQKIADRMIVLRTEMRAPLRATFLKRALPPTKPLEQVPYKQLAMACLGSFVLPFGLAFLWERRMRRITDARHLAREANLPVLGEIATLPTRSRLPGRKSSTRALRDRFTFEESIDALRVGVTQIPSFRDLQALVVTSAVSREGKTSLSYFLALSLARSTDQSVLLVDADMRAPDLHDMCGISRSPGLAEVLGGVCKVEDAVVAAPARGVFFLPAGLLTDSPHMFLKDRAFETLLDQLRPRYRYVVIDAPPVLAASEAVMIAAVADGTLVCAMRDVSRGPQLRLTCERLAASGARLLGTVISGVPTQHWMKKYGSYTYVSAGQSGFDTSQG